MAQMITVLGAMFGFFAAVVGFFAFEFSFLTAFSIWAFSGPAAAIMGFVIAGSDGTAMRTAPQNAFDAAA